MDESWSKSQSYAVVSYLFWISIDVGHDPISILHRVPCPFPASQPVAAPFDLEPLLHQPFLLPHLPELQAHAGLRYLNPRGPLPLLPQKLLLLHVDHTCTQLYVTAGNGVGGIFRSFRVEGGRFGGEPLA